MRLKYEPSGTASHFCEVVVLRLITVPLGTALNLRVLQVNPQAEVAQMARLSRQELFGLADYS